jgi:hypothetical protein
MNSFLKKKVAFAFGLLLCSNVFADSDHHGVGMELNSDGLKPVRADGHAPIGVMGEHMHKKGEWMLSYRYQYMDMEGNRIGETEVSNDFIVQNVANRFFGAPGQPPTLRIVPTSMTMEMHMFGAMYAPTDWLTLMVMGMHMDKSMDHVTYMGPAGTTVRGTFNTKASGMSDTKVSGMFKLLNNGIHKVHLNAGVSLPTGDTDETDDILTPMGMTPTVTLPYAMQLGSGTYDFLPGITYSATMNQLNWGAQYMGTIRTGDNNGYSWGDKHEVTSWLSYQWQPWISTSARLAYKHEGQIDGIDSRIAGPVQTADPDNYGGETVMLNFGVNLAGQTGRLRGHRVAFEAGFPIHQDLNGPQMETDLVLTTGWQFAF